MEYTMFFLPCASKYTDIPVDHVHQVHRFYNF